MSIKDDAIAFKQGVYAGKRELLEYILNHGSYIEETHDSTMSGGEIYFGLTKEEFKLLLKQFKLELR